MNSLKSTIAATNAVILIGASFANTIHAYELGMDEHSARSVAPQNPLPDSYRGVRSDLAELNEGGFPDGAFRVLTRVVEATNRIAPAPLISDMGGYALALWEYGSGTVQLQVGEDGFGLALTRGSETPVIKNGDLEGAFAAAVGLLYSTYAPRREEDQAATSVFVLRPPLPSNSVIV